MAESVAEALMTEASMGGHSRGSESMGGEPESAPMRVRGPQGRANIVVLPRGQIRHRGRWVDAPIQITLPEGTHRIRARMQAGRAGESATNSSNCRPDGSRRDSRSCLLADSCRRS